METKKKIKLFVALLCLLGCVTLIQSTYAKYITEASADANFTIARWNILVNNQDILEMSDFSTTIVPVFSGTENIREGFIAPTAKGYFDIEINGTATDVSFNYNIEIIPNETVEDLKITSYQIDDSEETAFNRTLTNTIKYNEENKVKKIRFFVEWKDGEGEELDNFEDVVASKAQTLSFDIKLDFVQVKDN